MDFDDPGAVAEAEVIAAATRLGFVVSRPISDGARYDLILGRAERLHRVQVKTATLEGEVIGVRLRTCRYTARGYVHTVYEPGEIDLVIAYCAELDECYVLPDDLVMGRTKVHLRRGPPRNHQRRRVHWAAQYQFGAIAQLGERLHGMQEVAGSSPASSI
jgi:PD-(D/E)XK endonuclease